MNRTKARAAWVAALRSGEYERGKEYLRTNDDKFRCLGVARTWGGAGEAALHNMNYRGVSFSEITDFIESAPDGLFDERETDESN